MWEAENNKPRSRGFVTVIAAISFIASAIFLWTMGYAPSVPGRETHKAGHENDRIVEIVGVRFQDNINNMLIRSTCQDYLKLQEACVRPDSGETYIESMIGGIDSSPEEFQHGLTHAFIMEFRSQRDREYFFTEDPNYGAFIEQTRQVVRNWWVMDFTPDVWMRKQEANGGDPSKEVKKETSWDFWPRLSPKGWESETSDSRNKKNPHHKPINGMHSIN